MLGQLPLDRSGRGYHRALLSPAALGLAVLAIIIILSAFVVIGAPVSP